MFDMKRRRLDHAGAPRRQRTNLLQLGLHKWCWLFGARPFSTGRGERHARHALADFYRRRHDIEQPEIMQAPALS